MSGFKRVICNYFVICGAQTCAHGRPHEPLYKAQYKEEPDGPASHDMVVKDNCANRPYRCYAVWKQGFKERMCILLDEDPEETHRDL